MYLNKKKNIILRVIYRPPGTDLETINECINMPLIKLKNEYKTCYLMGDYNVNLLNHSKHRETTEVVDILHSNYFVSLINWPTIIMEVAPP